MRPRGLLCLAFLSTLTGPALAADQFSCGGSDTRIEVLVRDSRMLDERAEGVVTMSRNGLDTVLRFRSIDFIGGQCVNAADGRPLVVFQAFCGGSGCNDGANWGVIDPALLRVLMVPTDSNRQEAQKLLGGALPALKMISVEREAVRQGVELF
ncbi:hypothetical protein [Massilia sp. IC2-476]|uniref:hypothetical protein n=1 Tax=Massilia sp. IC2-476 TaxID=2887199 RepID=UPI001D11670C|nr:hypothetical protein [Massilia sp. IC2-476]MCC2971350.1 hypothetical protein [Massilia sp. IC2-476]